MSGFIDYIYTHQETQASTGYFSCLPTPEPALAESLRLLAERPLDSFLHRHVLRTLGGLGPGDLRPRLAPLLNAENSGVISALLRELLALGHCRAEALEFLPDGTWDDDAQSTPLPLLRRAKTDDVDLQARWMELFRANLAEHRALPGPEQIGLPPLYAENHATPPVVRLDELYPLLAVSAGQGAPRTPAEETAALAEEALLRRGISAGGEQRHEASLSPVALLKPWRLDLRVACGRNKYTLTGRANTYGRGLSLPAALASCRMEMVERASAYAGVEGEKLVGTSGPAELVRATWSELERAAKNGGPRPLDPNDYHLDAPYADAPLYWMSGREIRRGPDGYAETPILAPVQLAYLFCNLDEPDLIDAPGSTGLAAGRTAAEARLAALTEILERDAQATTPYHRSGCFSLRAEDGFVAGLLADYAARGINVQFQDLTGPLGLPCYKCFVVGPRGQIAAGYGAGLSGRKALLSALTETPYPYPGGPPSGPLLRRLPQIRFEDLPDHSLNSPEQDLALLETLLCANGLNPAYLDLTRADLGFPVQRCLLKGLEPTADFDALARTPERLYFNYIKLWTPA